MPCWHCASGGHDSESYFEGRLEATDAAQVGRVRAPRVKPAFVLGVRGTLREQFHHNQNRGRIHVEVLLEEVRYCGKFWVVISLAVSASM